MNDKEKLAKKIESLKNDLELTKEKETSIALISDSDGYGEIETDFSSLEKSEKIELNFKIQILIEAYLVKKINYYKNELSKL